jgi:hypothetical protein
MKNKMLSLLCIFLFLAVFPSAGNAAAAHLPSQPKLEPGVPGAPEAPMADADYLSIPAAALLPEGEAENYENHGRYIKLIRGAAYESADFNAAVHLPHGAIITQVSTCFYDTVAENATVTLYRRAMHPGDPVEMVSLSSWGTSGYVQIGNTTIVDPVVDNANSVYWIELNIPFPPEGVDSVWGCGVTIRYTRPASRNGILAITSGVFKPMQWGYDYLVSQGSISHYGYENGSVESGDYRTQIDLPEGATVQKITIRTVDRSSSTAIFFWLHRVSTQGASQQLATLSSPNSTDHVETSTTLVDSPIIDNTNYAYYLTVRLPRWDINAYTHFFSVVIEYTYPTNQGYPTVALSNSAFTPFFDDLEYYNLGYNFFHAASEGSGTGNGVYLAPVYLPHGSKVSTVLFYYYDGTNTQNVSAYLVRTRLGDNEDMVTFTSSDDGGYGYGAKAAIHETIDNNLYAYFAYYVLPVTDPPYLTDDNVTPVFLAINYTSPPQSVYLPLVRK